MPASKLIQTSVIVVLMNCVHLNGQQLNEECTLRNGTKSVCVNIRNCPSAIALLQNHARAQTCGFNGKDPIVCCEDFSRGTINKPGTISEQKCKQFYAEFAIPSLPIYNVGRELASLRKKRTAVTNPSTFNLTTTEAPIYLVIAGGQNAKAQNYIHMAALGYGSSSNPNWSCGGSLVSEKFVLTAAHCIESRTLGRVQCIRIGDLNLKDTTDDAGAQTINISRIIVHPSYRPPLVYNDIALIELKSPAIINQYVRPACLQTKTEISDKRWIATGWGSTRFQGDAADHLQDVILREFTFEQCQSAFKGESLRRLNRGIDDNSQICAGENKKDTCQGDSGGPLQVQNVNAFIGYTIIGVTSFGRACALTTTPAVYTRVSHYIGWIESVVWPK